MNKKQKYAAIGFGSLVAGYILFNSKYAQARRFFLDRTSRGSKEIEVHTVNYKDMANINSRIPAVGMVRGPDGSYEYVSLNYTPRRASENHNNRLFNDTMYLDDPLFIPQEFKKLTKDQKEKMIHPNDYRILQAIGLIPENFPLDRVQYIKSYNGKNEYLVGYSNNFNINFGNLSVVEPVWAVSFGNNFDSSNSLSAFASEYPADLKDTLKRILFAEGLLGKQGEEGCSTTYDLTQCIVERNAIAGILLQRAKIRKDKGKATSDYFSNVINGEGVTWNNSKSFRATYRGYPPTNAQPDNTSFYKSTPREIPEPQLSQFNNYYSNMLWSMPQYGANASAFIHHKTMEAAGRSVPGFMSEEPLGRSGETGYANENRLLLGRTTVTNRSGRYA